MRRVLVLVLLALCSYAELAFAQDDQPWRFPSCQLVCGDGDCWLACDRILEDRMSPVVPFYPPPPPSGDPTPPTTTRGKWYTASEWALITCHALDTAYTQRLIGTGKFHETSPLLGQFQNPGLFVGVKFSITFGQLKATRTVARNGHPLLAAVTNAAVGGVMCGAAFHNARLFDDYERGLK